MRGMLGPVRSMSSSATRDGYGREGDGLESESASCAATDDFPGRPVQRASSQKKGNESATRFFSPSHTLRPAIRRGPRTDATFAREDENDVLDVLEAALQLWVGCRCRRRRRRLRCCRGRHAGTERPVDEGHALSFCVNLSLSARITKMLATSSSSSPSSSPSSSSSFCRGRGRVRVHSFQSPLDLACHTFSLTRALLLLYTTRLPFMGPARPHSRSRLLCVCACLRPSAKQAGARVGFACMYCLGHRI